MKCNGQLSLRVYLQLMVVADTILLNRKEYHSKSSLLNFDNTNTIMEELDLKHIPVYSSYVAIDSVKIEESESDKEFLGLRVTLKSSTTIGDKTIEDEEVLRFSKETVLKALSSLDYGNLTKDYIKANEILIKSEMRHFYMVNIDFLVKYLVTDLIKAELYSNTKNLYKVISLINPYEKLENEVSAVEKGENKMKTTEENKMEKEMKILSQDQRMMEALGSVIGGIVKGSGAAKLIGKVYIDVDIDGSRSRYRKDEQRVLEEMKLKGRVELGVELEFNGSIDGTVEGSCKSEDKSE